MPVLPFILISIPFAPDYLVHEMEVGKTISSNWIGHNNLPLTKKRIKKAERLHAAQLATYKKEVFTSYKHSVYEERKKKHVMSLQQ